MDAEERRMDMMNREPTRADRERRDKRDAASAVPGEITVDVLSKDIAEGKPGSDMYCPIALALDRMEYEGVRVRSDHCEVADEDGNWFLGDLPRIASDFIEAFDHAQDEEERDLPPFSFKMTLKEVRDGD